jgi:predicted TIM-barrel fold metal-dependent hydrolase
MMRGFCPNDRTDYPLYEEIALFHTGQTGVGSGMREGMGMRLRSSNPIHADDVAVDFPDMPIALAHPSFR